LSRYRAPAVFGAADGVTIVLGIIVSLAGQPHAVFRAAFGAGLAELVGMTAGAWLSDEKSGIWPAAVNGSAAFAACTLPAIPYLTGSGWAAVVPSIAFVAVTACLISVLRPEKGALAYVTTFGILALAAALCWAASLI
jgi:ABC-type uncharacterized transport system permease subunit